MMRLSGGLSLAEISVLKLTSGDLLITNCFKPLIQLPDGWYGYDYDQATTGILEPVYTSGSMFIYAVKFDTVSGDWIIQIGDDGNGPVLNSVQGIMQFNLSEVDNILMVWNESNLRYEGNDIDAAANVVSHIGEDICFSSAFVPREVIHYSFAELAVKGITEVVTTTVQRVLNWVKGY